MVGGGTPPGADGAHLVLAAAAAGGREEKASLVKASFRREALTCVPANALLKIVSIAFLKINILVIMARGWFQDPHYHHCGVKGAAAFARCRFASPVTKQLNHSQEITIG